MLWFGIVGITVLFLFNATSSYNCGGSRSAAFSTAMLALAIFTNTLGMHHTWKYAQNVDPLPDSFHNFYSTSSESQLPNILFVLNLATCVIGVWWDPEFHWRISRFFFLFSTLTIIRGLVLLMTVFPYTRHVPQCDTPPTGIFSTFVFVLSGEFTCADYALSGHTSISILCSVMLYIAFSHRPTLIGLAGVYISVFLSIYTVISLLYYRWHYTLDVYVAAVTVSLVLLVYVGAEPSMSSAIFYFRKRNSNLPDYLNGRPDSKK